jgi:azurin
MADNEKNLLPVKEALGHSTIVVTADRYTHVINDGLRKAFERAAFKPADSVHKVSTEDYNQANLDLNRLKVS